MTYIPLHVHSHFSVLDGLSQAKHIVKRCKSIEVSACALTDHGTISGTIDFLTKMEKAELKPILGCELYISREDAGIKEEDNRKLTHLPVLAKNTQGWKQLIKIVSESNRPDYFYYKPRLSLVQLSEFLDGNTIGFSGHLGSDIASAVLNKEYTELKDNWLEEGSNLALWLQEAFGEGNFYLEVQLMDHVKNPIQKVAADAVREISKKTGIPCIATPDAHYCRQEDAEEHRILLCSNLRTTMAKAKDTEFAFFKSNNYHIPSYEEMVEYGHTEEELNNTIEIANKVEKYEVLHNPILPPFPCPNDADPAEYLRQLCRDGWREKIADVVPKEEHQVYVDRIKEELDILQGANLSSYFLIVRDICKFVTDNGWLIGPGRGSAAGCLVSYLIGVTGIDPIPYDLIFSRFYNSGRNTADHISMPDIDIDVPVDKREEIINYIKDKYGHDKVAQIITYTTLGGRKALKEVFRAYGEISFEESNRITSAIPDKALFATELELMKQQTGESSLIKWALQHKGADLDEWCKIDEEGVLSGPLAKEFGQAIKLEGTKAAPSKHAAGIVISLKPMKEMCPFVYDAKTKSQIAGWEMNDAEGTGLVKLDVLGVAMLTKIMGIEQILRTGDIL